MSIFSVLLHHAVMVPSEARNLSEATNLFTTISLFFFEGERLHWDIQMRASLHDGKLHANLDKGLEPVI